MNRIKPAMSLLLVFVSLLMCADSCHFSDEVPFDFETQVFVYADANANGVFDEGEKPIPNAVVTLVSFPPSKDVEGAVDDSSMVYRTDDAGKANLQGNTFRYYEVGSLTPCGYHATSVMRQDFSKNVPLYHLGFVPDQPQTGSSLLEIHFWIDQDGDGIQDLDETDLAETDIELEIFWDGIDEPGASGGSVGYSFELKTDDGGRVRLELGNVCETFSLGRITVDGRVQDEETTYVSPNVKAVDYSFSDNKIIVYEFDSIIGKTSIEWGVRLSDF